MNFAITAFSEVRAAILDASFAADLELRWPVQGPEIIRRYTEADPYDDRAQGRPVHLAGDHVSQLAAQWTEQRHGQCVPPIDGALHG